MIGLGCLLSIFSNVRTTPHHTTPHHTTPHHTTPYHTIPYHIYTCDAATSAKTDLIITLLGFTSSLSFCWGLARSGILQTKAQSKKSPLLLKTHNRQKMIALTLFSLSLALPLAAPLAIRALKEDPRSYVHQNQETDVVEFSGYRVYTAPNNAKFYVEGSGNDIVKNHVRSGAEWERELREVITKYAKEGSVALDVGAHIGIHSVTMSRVVGEKGTVYAFEPQPRTYKELRINLALNECKNVFALKLALGNERGTIGLGQPIPGNEGGRYISRKNPIEYVKIARLDDFELDNVSFVKIDVESFEEETLLGAAETIKRNKPVIYIEIHSAHSDTRPANEKENRDAEAERIKNWIVGMGYTLVPYPQSNYLALPVGKKSAKVESQSQVKQSKAKPSKV